MCIIFKITIFFSGAICTLILTLNTSRKSAIMEKILGLFQMDHFPVTNKEKLVPLVLM